MQLSITVALPAYTLILLPQLQRLQCSIEVLAVVRGLGTSYIVLGLKLYGYIIYLGWAGGRVLYYSMISVATHSCLHACKQ